MDRKSSKTVAGCCRAPSNAGKPRVNFQGSSWETVEASGSQHLGPASAASNRDHAVALGAIAAKLRKTQYGRVKALRVARRPAQFRQFRQTTMTGDQGKASGKGEAGVKDSRRDRLKLALRENLKRRKSQARGRTDAASSESAETSLDDAGGEKP